MVKEKIKKNGDVEFSQNLFRHTKFDDRNVVKDVNDSSIQDAHLMLMFMLDPVLPDFACQCPTIHCILLKSS